MTCCLKQENNRQSLVSLGAMGALVGVLQAHRSSPRVVRTACRALRTFTFDDDVRQAFGKAHEHARQLAEDHGLIAFCLELIEGLVGYSSSYNMKLQYLEFSRLSLSLPFLLNMLGC